MEQLLNDLSKSSDPRLRRARYDLSKTKNDLKLRGDLCNNISHIYAEKEDYERAFRWARIDLKISEQRGDIVSTVIGLRVWYVVVLIKTLYLSLPLSLSNSLPTRNILPPNQRTIPKRSISHSSIS